MTKKKNIDKDFKMFAELASIINPRYHKEVREIMETLHPCWRDDLCRALIDYVNTGNEKAYPNSLVMRNMLKKTIQIISTDLSL